MEGNLERKMNMMGQLELVLFTVKCPIFMEKRLYA